jgi:chemotaxis protein methyltransferase CheR
MRSIFPVQSGTQPCLEGKSPFRGEAGEHPPEPVSSPQRKELQALDWIIALVYQRSHIRLGRNKEALIRSRLGKRMRALGLATLPDYRDYLAADSGGEEIGRAIDALTTNFTHFLREPEHFQFMVAEALPRLLARNQRSFRVWSAACATGEEPYTIAFHLQRQFPLEDAWDWRIWATDISTAALQKAIQGVYPEERLRNLPSGWIPEFFQRGVGRCAGLCRVKKRLQERVTFQQLNLLAPLPCEHTFEIIFCRNVMIYFDRPTQHQLAVNLSRVLRTGGYLFTGKAESLGGLAAPLRCLSPSVYQKPD